MLATIAAVGTAAALLTGPVTTAGAGVPIGVSVASVNGSGCPSGSATATVGEDGTVTISYSGFAARRGVGIPITEQRRNCQTSLAVQVPAGYTYSVAGLQSTGSSALAAGATALQNTNLYYQGQSATTALPHSFTGPTAGPWSTADSGADLAALGAAPCGSAPNLNLNAELRVAAGTSAAGSASSITIASTTVALVATPCGT